MDLTKWWGSRLRDSNTARSVTNSRRLTGKSRKIRPGRVFERLEDRRMLAGGISQATPGYFVTWGADGGLIRSTDVAGITFEPDAALLPGQLYLADSEINETPEFQGDNIFEVSLDGSQVLREITSNNDEPTGITFNEFDGYFYVTNDNDQTITRYDSDLNNPLEAVMVAAT